MIKDQFTFIHCQFIYYLLISLFANINNKYCAEFEKEKGGSNIIRSEIEEFILCYISVNDIISNGRIYKGNTG